MIIILAISIIIITLFIIDYINKKSKKIELESYLIDALAEIRYLSILFSTIYDLSIKNQVDKDKHIIIKTKSEESELKIVYLTHRLNQLNVIDRNVRLVLEQLKSRYLAFIYTAQSKNTKIEEINRTSYHLNDSLLKLNNEIERLIDKN